MKHLQQILWLLILCSNTVLYAQTTEYDPNDPPEPENLFSLSLNMNSTNAGYISGAGNYPKENLSGCMQASIRVISLWRGKKATPSFPQPMTFISPCQPGELV